jgi:hypothetical protein
LIERLTALLPKAKAAGPSKLVVEFVDPRWSKLTDEELAMMEAIVCKMNDMPPDDAPPPTAEQLALEALRQENERLRAEKEWTEKQLGSIIHQYERERCERANASANVVPARAPAPAAGLGRDDVD